MINSEKELEDFICNNQEEFIKSLKKNYYRDNIEFVGRQVRIGNDNIADLVYIIKEDDEIPIRELIIVELKYRELQCKDLAQIMRYMSCIEEKDMNLNFENVYGCFVSFGCSSEMQDVLKYQEHIKCMKLICQYAFSEEQYSYKEEYLENLKLDNRLEKYMINKGD